jgi:phage repressor protein C with HTH and peptisase S24 domain
MKERTFTGARRVLWDAMQARQPRVTMKALSEAIGKNAAYIQQYLDRNSPESLGEEEREAIARYLQIDPNRLRDQPVTKIGGSTSFPIRMAPPPAYGGPDLPIMGRAHGAGGSYITLNTGRVGMTERPAFLIGVTDAFAFYVVEDSMVPRFKPGELCYVNPNKPPVAGDDVLIEFEDGSGVVKELIRQTEGKVTVRQHNPPKTLSYDLAKVKTIRFIQGSRR